MPHDEGRYDLFVSYAHKDDQGQYAGRVTALKQWIEREFQRVTSRALRVFFDADEIPAMSVWEHRILTGLRQSRIMLAVLSPSYFASDYCRREWEEYVNQELAHALPGEGIAPIYVLRHPAFDDHDVDRSLDRWLQNLKRRQYVDCVQWWPEGQQALEREGVRRHLEQVRDQIVQRLDYAVRRDASPHNLPPYNPRFVGRVDELHKIRAQLIRSQIGAITAVHGLGGIGKSALAVVYGHAYGHEYPGGRFWINCAGLHDLGGALIALAPLRGLHFTPPELARPDECLARVKALFAQGPATLFILDNVDDPNLLSPTTRRAALPAGDHIHVLATTRLQGSSLQGVAWLSVDALSAEDALALLARYRPIADTPQDDEWKAAVAIVERLGGHALALEVVAVYLAEHPAITYRQYLAGLEHEGVSLIEFAAATNQEQAAQLSMHVEQSLSKLLAPTLDLLSPAERSAVEFAALLPPDHVPLPWLATLLRADYLPLAGDPAPGRPDPLQELFDKLRRLRLIVPGDDARIGRIHRIVQEVLKGRMPGEAQTLFDQRLFQLALERAANMERRWGPDCVWEVGPLAAVVTLRLGMDDGEIALMAAAAADGLRQLGRYVDARRLYQRCLEIFERLSRAMPNDVAIQRGTSVSYGRLAELSLAEGDAVEARRLYRRGLEISERLDGALSDNVRVQRDLAIAYTKLGELSLAEGDTVEARRLYRRGLEISERLAGTQPDNVTAQRDLSESCDILADLSREEGDLIEARWLHQRALEIRERLARALPDDVRVQRHLLVSYSNLAGLSLAEGNSAEARRLYQRSLEISERLARALPDDVTAQHDLLTLYGTLANLSRAEGSRAEARRLYRLALEISERLARAVPNDVRAQRGLSVSYNQLADLSFAEGDLAEARLLRQRGFGILERLARAMPDDVTAQRDLAWSHQRLADLSLAEGHSAEALYQAYLEIIERLARMLPRDVQSQRDLAVSHYKMQQFARQMGDEPTYRERACACYQQLERMLTAGMPLDPPMQRLHRQLTGMFGGPPAP
jgi:tetratricopeptide (TPR) repeat protein